MGVPTIILSSSDEEDGEYTGRAYGRGATESTPDLMVRGGGDFGHNSNPSVFLRIAEAGFNAPGANEASDLHDGVKGDIEDTPGIRVERLV